MFRRLLAHGWPNGCACLKQVNGKLVEPSHALANAEVVEVLTYQGPPTSLTVARHQVRRACVGVARVVLPHAHPCFNSRVPWHRPSC